MGRGGRRVRRVRFRDVAREAGLDFVLQNSPSPRKHLIETMPGGVALFDYDGDGRLDVFFTNGAAVPSLEKDDPKYASRLFRNEGGLRFRDVTEAAGLRGAGYSMGVAAADYDNDGRTDLFVGGRASPGPLPQPRGTVRGRHRRRGSGRRSVGGWRRVVRLRQRRPARPAGRELHGVDGGDGSVLRRLLAGHPRLLPSKVVRAGGAEPVSQPRRRHLRGRDREVRARALQGARDGDRIRGLRPGRLPGRLRRERQAPQLPSAQPQGRHVRRGRPAGRRVAPRARPGRLRHGRGLPRLRQRRAARHPGDRAGGGELSPVPEHG